MLDWGICQAKPQMFKHLKSLLPSDFERSKPTLNLPSLQLLTGAFSDFRKDDVRTVLARQKFDNILSIAAFILLKPETPGFHISNHDPLGSAEMSGQRSIRAIRRHHHCDFTHRKLSTFPGFPASFDVDEDPMIELDVIYI